MRGVVPRHPIGSIGGDLVGYTLANGSLYGGWAGDAKFLGPDIVFSLVINRGHFGGREHHAVVADIVNPRLVSRLLEVMISQS